MKNLVNFVFQSTFKMDSKKYLDDISEIKAMMHRSSRFISLSGLSGVMAGIYALIGAALAFLRLGMVPFEGYRGFYSGSGVPSRTGMLQDLILIALGVLVAAVVTGALLTIKKAKASGEKIWDVSSRLLVVNFCIPLFAGGVFCLVLLQKGIISLVAPATLLFYGLACVNASKYTMRDIRYMGLAFVFIGLLSTQFIGYGIYFWALGFGGFHIFYGALMHYKYDRK